jgi:TolA-binding protein
MESERKHHEVAAQPLPADDAFDLDLFRARHERNIIIAVVALVVIAVVAGIWLTVDHYRRLGAEELFANAKDMSAWQEVIAKYPHSEPAANAYFLVAAGLRDAGKVDESTAEYQKFLTEFPNHPLAGGALIGIGQNQEVQGKPQDAIQTYITAHSQYPKSYAAPFALFCQAGILLREYKLDEARRVLTDLVAEYGDAAVAQMAQAQLQRLDAILEK